jgi:hypothetical protein
MSQPDPRFGRLLDLQRELDARKALYAEFDALLLSLVRDGALTAEIDGLVLEIKDTFAESNTGWTRSAVRRFDLEVITKELQAKREKRKEKVS